MAAPVPSTYRIPVWLLAGTAEPIDLGELDVALNVHTEVVDGQPQVSLRLDSGSMLGELADLLEKGAADLRATAAEDAAPDAP